MKKRMISRSVSFIKKNEVYVFYIDFSFIFLRGIAARLMDAILEKASLDGWFNLDGVPEDFILYLISKKIVVEEAET